MLTHKQIWSAIDALAARNGLSPSGLAKLAGLDPTTFNKSKRGDATGKLRWPSTESISKILNATSATLDEFVSLVEGVASRTRMVPLIGMAQAGSRGYFDDAGFPAGSGWEEIAFPELADEHAYALEITGDSMQPVYRDGDRIVVSPSTNPRRGDRVVVKTLEGEVMAKLLHRMTAQRIELRSLNPAHEDRSFALNEIVFVHRIIWASQ
ncbi:MAG TPA: helix-turn-helix transcriptional regulator [Rhizomicrobium sp.]|jgi:phage repressor protein C with HTH and peptisase S24 domain|nr:helix-turn-helix transcriptional regulator [Rhizomicrobium sp.]